MANITAAPVLPVHGAFATNPSYSGTFIPTLWSSRMNVAYYEASTFADISNTDWENEIKKQGDKVIIRNRPSIRVVDYVIGQGLTEQTVTPSVTELLIDRAKAFAFPINSVIEVQSDIKLLNEFSDVAAEEMRISVDADCFYRTFTDAAATNKGATAGKHSGSYNLGTDAAPVELTGANVLTLLTAMASTLDEQSIPESDRFLVIDPATRLMLMQSNLAQAQFTGDASSPVRNGKIGMIDRFTVYVTNHLPRAAKNGDKWISGDGQYQTIATAQFAKSTKRVIMAGHRSAITFASQMSTVEHVHNPKDFGYIVRGVQVYGAKVVNPNGLALAVVA